MGGGMGGGMGVARERREAWAQVGGLQDLQARSGARLGHCEAGGECQSHVHATACVGTVLQSCTPYRHTHAHATRTYGSSSPTRGHAHTHLHISARLA